MVDNKNGTYTLVAVKVKNLQPYHAPEFITIKNMKNKTNVDGKQFTFTLYKSPYFFNNTVINDEDGLLTMINPPKR